MHTASKVAQICTGVYFARMSKLRVYFMRLIFGSKGQDIVQRFRRARPWQAKSDTLCQPRQPVEEICLLYSSARTPREASAISVCGSATSRPREQLFPWRMRILTFDSMCPRHPCYARFFLFFFFTRQDTLFQTTNIHSCLGDRHKCT